VLLRLQERTARFHFAGRGRRSLRPAAELPHPAAILLRRCERHDDGGGENPQKQPS
jgi:hypothetical protein